jgi:DNA-directed RNA polymerase specialized sigma24 family protein
MNDNTVRQGGYTPEGHAPRHELYQKWFELRAREGATDAEWDALLTDPLVSRKMLNALRTVLGPAAGRERLCDDVLQQAWLVLLQKSRRCPGLNCEDRGGEQFEGFLYQACKWAVQSGYDAVRRAIGSKGAGDLALLLGSVARQERLGEDWREVAELIRRHPEGRVRQALGDFAAGVPAGETAERLGVSPARVSQLRDEGVRWLRERLAPTRPRRPGLNRSVTLRM